MRLQRANLFALLALLALAGCGDDGSPEDRVLPLGTYAYTAQAYTSALGPINLSGTLTITSASADEVSGTWQVPGLAPPVELGGWNVDAYLVGAAGQDIPLTRTPGFILHRVARSGSGLSCTGRHAPPGDARTYPVTCTLARQ